MPTRIPLPILILFIVDIFLAALYALHYLAGSPSVALTHLINLGGEANLPTWYSSMQWFCSGIVFGIFAHRHVQRSNWRTWSIASLPLIFFALSLDEVALLHEIAGTLSNKAITGVEMEDSSLPATGFWMIMIGVPFVALLGGIVYSIRGYFASTPSVLARMLVGMGVMLGGALGIETLSNFVEKDSGLGVLQILAEETLEMLGSTIVLWSAFELLKSHGFRYQLAEIPLVSKT